MRVGFDLSPLARSFSPGMTRLARGLVDALERRGRIEVVRLAPPEGRGLRAWRQLDLPREARRRGLAGLHSLTSAFPWRGPGARVQTIHELPWKHGEAENAGLAHRFWASVGPRRADAVVCPSERTARDLGGPSDRVRVAPWGVGAPFEEEPSPGSVDEVVPGRYGLPERAFVLCPGAVRAKKRLAAVLHGLARLHERGEPPLHLVVTGEPTADLRRDLGLVARLGLSRWVSTPGWIADEDLPALLRLATAVPLLSRSEGFGFPVLEAIACGTPVLVPPGSAQAEIPGELGIAVDPDDPDSVADGLARARAEREALRYRLAARARERFLWDACAERVEALWRELAP